MTHPCELCRVPMTRRRHPCGTLEKPADFTRRLKQRREQEQTRILQKLKEHGESASTPPPLEQLIGKIGRKV